MQRHLLGAGDTVEQAVLAELVQQETYRTPVHPIDRDRARQSPVQGFQQEAVTAKGYDDFRPVERRIAVPVRQPYLCVSRLVRIGSDEGYQGVSLWHISHGARLSLR